MSHSNNKPFRDVHSTIVMPSMAIIPRTVVMQRNAMMINDISLETMLTSPTTANPEQANSVDVDHHVAVSMSTHESLKELDSHVSPTPITMTHNVSDAHESNWPEISTEFLAPDRQGIFRIDDLIANQICSKWEQERRRTTIAHILKKLGIGLDDARRYSTRASAETQAIITQDRPSIEAPQKKRRSHRQIPKQATASRVIRYLEQLPEGYAIFQTRRKPEGILSANNYDTYIIGSEVGWFYSADSFIPHLAWIDRGMPVYRPCTCKQCAEKYNSKIQTSEVSFDLNYHEDDGDWRGRTGRGKRGVSDANAGSGDNTNVVGVTANKRARYTPESAIEQANASSYPTPPFNGSIQASLGANAPDGSVLIPLGRQNASQRRALLAQTSFSSSKRTFNTIA